MALTDLVFKKLKVDTTTALVFGEVDVPVLVDATIDVSGSLPTLTGSVGVTLGINVSSVHMLPGLTGTVAVVYVSDTARPTVSQRAQAWQVATPLETGAEATHKLATKLPAECDQAWQIADPLRVEFASHFTNSTKMRVATTPHFQGGAAIRHSAIGLYQDAKRDVRLLISSLFSDGDKLNTPTTSVRHQDALRSSRNSATARNQPPVPYSILATSKSGKANPLKLIAVAQHQWAMRPPHGVRPVIVVPPVPGVCYTPTTALVFRELMSGNTDLVFICGNYVPPPTPVDTVVVPVQRVYVVINEVSLRRVVGDIQLPCFGSSMSLDYTSWTWTFSATLPLAALPNVLRAPDGDPIEIETIVNGVPYRMLVGKVTTTRSFGQDAIRINARGKNSILDAPFALEQFFSNAAGARTAQQLVDDALMVNGVSLGWTVDWNLTDWLVPAGVFSHRGSHISAINAIAAAAGGYVQPANTANQLRILPEYPVAPWEWASVTPDYELPVDITTQEDIEYVDKPDYNRVFVSGQSVGVLGQVTRTGTAGEIVAPMVVDPLITHADAARQRGIAVLSNTGRIVNVTLRTPVLPETGVILPGKFIDYVDGATVRRGLTRSVSVDSKLPETWQSIVVEIHESV